MTDILDRASTTASAEVADYTTIRTSVGAYQVTAPLVRVTGDDRLALLDQFLSKASDFVEPETTRECLALAADGSPFAVLLHLELGEESWLLPRTPVSGEALRDYLSAQDLPGDVTVEVDPEGWGATAFEGPLAWSVAAGFVDFDISGLTLHAITPVVVPDAPEEHTAYLARVGTTGEYGYLLLSDAPEEAATAVSTATAEAGGAQIGPKGLARVQAEAGMPFYHHGLDGLSVGEADLAWMVSWDRVGEFHGSENLSTPTVDAAKLTPVVAPAGAVIPAGTAVTAGGVGVGAVVWQIPSANPDEELLFALVESPFWTTGLELAARDANGEERPLRTVTLPRVVARSSHTRIG